MGLNSWIILVASCSILYPVLPKSKRPQGYQCQLIFHVTNTLFILATIDRTRTLPYSALYCLPVALAHLQHMMSGEAAQACPLLFRLPAESLSHARAATARIFRRPQHTRMETPGLH